MPPTSQTWDPEQDAEYNRQAKVLSMFRFIGHLVAKAIIDGRNLPLPLSKPFIKLILGQGPLGFVDLFEVDPAFARSFEPIYAVAKYVPQATIQGRSTPAITTTTIVTPTATTPTAGTRTGSIPSACLQTRTTRSFA